MADIGRREKDLDLVEDFETVRAVTSDGRSVQVPKSKFGGNLEVASDNVLGGIKASPKSDTDTNEVKIDPNTGKLYCPPSEVAVATASKVGGIVAEAKTSNETGEVKIDSSTGKLYAPKGNGTPPDEEDITIVSKGGSSVLQFKNRGKDKGMGYIILRTGESLSSQMSETNTIYEVRYNFDMNGETLSVPDNCVLKFEGGSIANGTINGTFEVRTSKNGILFNNVSVGFKITNHTIESEWFGEISESVDSSIAINKSLSAAQSTNVVRFPRRSFTVANPIVVSSTRTIDGRNYKNRIGTNVIIPTANISVFVIGSGFIDGSLRNVSIQPSSSSSQLRKYVGIEMTGCESFVVENVKVQYADIAYKLVTQTQISVPTFKDISAHDCNTGMRIEGLNGGWANGIEVKPYWFTNNYTHFHILGGQVTTIQGGSVEIGNSGTKPSWFGSSPRGILTENNAIVNIYGCIWGENVNGSSTGYYIEAKGFSKINIYGDAWITDYMIMSDYAQINYFGSSHYGNLSYGAHSENVARLPMYYVSAKNCKWKNSTFCTPIDCMGKTAPDWNLRILRLSDGTPYFSTITLNSNIGDGSEYTNFSMAFKYVKTTSNQMTLLLNGGWTNTIVLTESSSNGIIRIKQGDNTKNSVYFKRRRREASNYEQGIIIVSFDYDNNRIITMDTENNFSEGTVDFLSNLPFDPFNYIFNFETDSGVRNFYLTDIVFFDSILSAADFIWWMDFLKNGGAEPTKIGTQRPDTAEMGHSFFNTSTNVLSVKASEEFSSTSLKSVNWVDIGNATTASVSETE